MILRCGALGQQVVDLGGQVLQARRCSLRRALAGERAGAAAEVDREQRHLVSWVVKALVEATEISGPAWV